MHSKETEPTRQSQSWGKQKEGKQQKESPKNCPEAARLAKLSATEFAWRETSKKLRDGLRLVISRMTSMLTPGGPGKTKEGSDIHNQLYPT